MTLDNWRQVETTRKKLRVLQEHYEKVRESPADDQHLRVLTLGSLKKFMNQLQEEITLFECHARSRER